MSSEQVAETQPQSGKESKLPTTQKTWRIKGKGKPEVALELVDNSPIPKLSKGELLVKVQAVALNPV